MRRVQQVSLHSGVGALSCMAHPARLLLLYHLCLEDQLCVPRMKQLSRLSSPALSQHLRLMTKEQLIEPVRVGKRRCYRLREKELVKNMVRTLVDGKRWPVQVLPPFTPEANCPNRVPQQIKEPLNCLIQPQMACHKPAKHKY